MKSLDLGHVDTTNSLSLQFQLELLPLILKKGLDCIRGPDADAMGVPGELIFHNTRTFVLEFPEKNIPGFRFEQAIIFRLN